MWNSSAAYHVNYRHADKSHPRNIPSRTLCVMTFKMYLCIALRPSLPAACMEPRVKWSEATLLTVEIIKPIYVHTSSKPHLESARQKIDAQVELPLTCDEILMIGQTQRGYVGSLDLLVFFRPLKLPFDRILVQRQNWKVLLVNTTPTCATIRIRCWTCVIQESSWYFNTT